MRQMSEGVLPGSGIDCHQRNPWDRQFLGIGLQESKGVDRLFLHLLMIIMLAIEIGRSLCWSQIPYRTETVSNPSYDFSIEVLKMLQSTNFDVVILGTGPAGLQAAIHAARKKVSVLVLGKETKSSIFHAHVENFCCLFNVSGEDMLSG